MPLSAARRLFRAPLLTCAAAAVFFASLRSAKLPWLLLAASYLQLHAAHITHARLEKRPGCRCYCSNTCCVPVPTISRKDPISCLYPDNFHLVLYVDSCCWQCRHHSTVPCQHCRAIAHSGKHCTRRCSCRIKKSRTGCLVACCSNRMPESRRHNLSRLAGCPVDGAHVSSTYVCLPACLQQVSVQVSGVSVASDV